MKTTGGIRFGKPKDIVPTSVKSDEASSEPPPRDGFKLRNRTSATDELWDNSTRTSVNPIILIAAVMAPVMVVALIASKSSSAALGFDNERLVEKYANYLAMQQSSSEGAVVKQLPSVEEVRARLFRIAQLENAGERDRAKLEWGMLLRETKAVPANPLLSLSKTHVR